LWDTTAGYGDRWASAAEYLAMLEARLHVMHRLLSPGGTLYLHLDWHASAYARILLDEIFGPERLLNEIAWVYHGPSPIQRAFNRKHDTLLAYTKSAEYLFNSAAVRVPYDPETIRTFRSSPKAGFGKIPDLQRGKVPEDWWYFPVVARLHGERTGYPTQKPEALLERILQASSPPGGLVGDFFCGSGTTLACAERLRREWIGCDENPLAIHVTQRRLLLQERTRPFRVESTAPKPPSLKPVATVARSGAALAVELAGVRTAGRRTPGLEDIDLWEVDWDYSGGAFHSRSQAVRAWRSSQLERRLERRFSSSRRRTIGVRVVARDGATGLLTLDA
jgi:DNA modification methylase